PEEQALLTEQFGEVPRWGDTLKPFLWTHVSAIVPVFTASTEFQLPVPCSFDFELTVAKYFRALGGGDIPLLLLFSGTIFAKGEAGLQASQVPWNTDVSYRLPLQVWRDLAEIYFPNSGWLRLRHETLSELLKFKSRRALASWDDVIEALLKEEAPAQV